MNMKLKFYLTKNSLSYCLKYSGVMTELLKPKVLVTFAKVNLKFQNNFISFAKIK